MNMFYKISKYFILLISLILAILAANSNILFNDESIVTVPVGMIKTYMSCAAVIAAGFEYKFNRIRICYTGSVILAIFSGTAIVTIILQVINVIGYCQDGFDIPNIWSINIALVNASLTLMILFWTGIVLVYISSVQLGIKYRILGIIVGFVPIANLFMLGVIMSITFKEVHYERSKEILNDSRIDQKICATKYPILLVHGVFFRDSASLNYWGRIPSELEMNGATLFYGNNESAQSVEISAATLADRIKQIVDESGCEKINIIAHSKGGLDSRYAIQFYGVGEYVASLTTINTPHRGCEFTDYLLNKVPTKTKDRIAKTYNAIFKKLGDKNPDFIAAVSNLAFSFCEPLDKQMPQPEGIYCQSVGSKLNRATGGRFPLNISYNLVKRHDGENDGLVGKESFIWGDKFTYLTVEGKRGISHGDMIDLNRENFPTFDVREFFVQLVSDLKEKGL